MRKPLKRVLLASAAGAVLATGAGVPAHAAPNDSNLVPPYHRTNIYLQILGPGKGWCRSVTLKFDSPPPMKKQKPRDETVTVCNKDVVVKRFVSNHTRDTISSDVRYPYPYPTIDT